MSCKPDLLFDNRLQMKLSRFSLFKLPNKYKRFDYAPRHYDPLQEEREKRSKQLEAEREIDVNQGSGKSISFRSPLRENRSEYKNQALQSNIRVLLILGVLLVVGYYLFQRYDVLEMLGIGSENQ